MAWCFVFFLVFGFVFLLVQGENLCLKLAYNLGAFYLVFLLKNSFVFSLYFLLFFD